MSSQSNTKNMGETSSADAQAKTNESLMRNKSLQEKQITEFLGIMNQEKSDSDEVLKKAFEVLNKAQSDQYLKLSPVDFLLRCTELMRWEVEETIYQVKKHTETEVQQLNYQEFVKIIKLLKNPSVMDQLKRIYESFWNIHMTNKFILYGESGVGKTWMARQVAIRALRELKSDFALWVYLDRIYDTSSLIDSLVYQLSIPRATKKDQESEYLNLINSALKKKRLLLILDSEGSKMNYDNKELRSIKNGASVNLNEILALVELESFKILVTRKDPPMEGERGMRVMPWTRDEANSLIKNTEILNDLTDYFIGKSRCFPSEILIVAKTLNYISEDKTRVQMLEYNLEKFKKEKTDYQSNEKLEKERIDLWTMLINRYEMLPKRVLIDCFSSETLEGHFLTRGKWVGYNELISYWILEGHLGHFTRIKDAYEEGHRVLMELLELGLLKNQESGHVVPAGIRFRFDVQEYYEFFRGIHLGLGTTFDCRLGKIAVGEGTLRSVPISDGGKVNEISTLILDGNHIGKIEIGGIFVSDSKVAQNPSTAGTNTVGTSVENLAIFNPTGKYFPLNMSSNSKLRLFVVRACEFFDTAENIFQNFREQNNLTAFELSGPSPLKEIPDDVFKNMSNIKNLNLSSLNIKSLPKIFYDNFTSLEVLILRDCRSLEKIDTLKNFKNLEVLDISGSTSVTSFHDKKFWTNDKLRVINLSGTSIETLPVVSHLENLKSLSLKDCASLTRIRKIASLGRLQILDISGAAIVEEFLDPCLETLTSLHYLDISKTALTKLPSNIGNPQYLYMRECQKLTRLTPIEGLSKVQVLDLSDSSNLGQIRVKFFKNVVSLKELNLSRTCLSDLSFLSCLGTLRKLFLSKCLSLEKLENLSELKELEILDLSGCEKLREIKDESFNKMYLLNSLDVSGLSLVDKLPSLSNNKSLEKLLVKDCPQLTSLEGLDQIPTLKIFDHSRTYLKPAPNFHPDSHPIVLGPVFPSMENIDYNNLLANLGAIDPTCLQHNQEESSEPYCNWSISSWKGQENGHSGPVSGFHFLHLLKMYPSLLKDAFEKFKFLIYPSDEPANRYFPDKDDYADETFVRDVYLSQVTEHNDFSKRLEIRGFTDVPLCVKHLLQESEFVILIDSPFLSFLHDLDISGIKNVRACWVERCNNMEHAVRDDSHENNLNGLETLWISSTPRLRSIFPLEIPNISFQGLKSLYLEFCPNLSSLCSSFRQLQNLQVLYIKYCKNFSSLFSEDLDQMPNLTALHLWGLPQLKRIVVGMQSLATLRIGECPQLEFTLPTENQKTDHGMLKNLHIKFCDNLSSIFEPQLNSYLSGLEELEVCGLRCLKGIEFNAPNLKSLKIAELPLLENVAHLGTTSLKILEIKSCEKLLQIFEDGSLTIERMELLCLPVLHSIGAHAKVESKIWGCPELKSQHWTGRT